MIYILMPAGSCLIRWIFYPAKDRRWYDYVATIIFALITAYCFDHKK